MEERIEVYVDDDLGSIDVEHGLAGLPEWRRRRAMAYRNERDRRLSVAAYRLLRRGLADVFGIHDDPPVDTAEGGKPFVVGRPDVHFNLSHCPVAAICAVATVPVGVDIERIRPYNEALAERVLSPDELLSVRQSPRPDVAFIRLWTMKESLLKLTGEGIRRELRTVLDAPNVRFATTERPDKGYVYTVCRFA